MNAYMLRNNETGLFYRRTKGNYSPSVWVEQEKASIWVTKNGPTQSKSLAQNKRRRGNVPHDLEIVTFDLVEKT